MQLRLRKTRDQLRREAADWFNLLQSGRDPNAEAKFQLWYSADPAHAAAFERVCDSHQRSGLLRLSAYSSEKLAATQQARPGVSSYALAAAAAVALVVAGLLLRFNLIAPGETDAVMLKTNIGEIRRVALGDGSSVTLDTSTSVEVDLSHSHRKARVNYGRVRFQLTAGEPFAVEAGSETVTAEKGIIDVEHVAQLSRVDVLAGNLQLHVAGADGGRQLALSAREGAISDDGSPLKTYKLTATTDWTRGMLQFDATQLSDVVVAANRYSNQHLILDCDCGELRVTGAFRVGDNKGLARALAAAFNLSARQSADANWHLSKFRPN